MRRSCRVRDTVRSKDRSKLKKLNFSPRQPSRGRNQLHDTTCGAVPGFGEPEIVWSNGEDDSPVAPVFFCWLCFCEAPIRAEPFIRV